MSDPLEKIEKKEPNFMKRHVIEAYKAYVNNNRRKGLYMVKYDCIEEALHKFDFVFSYVMDQTMIQSISLMSSFKFNLYTCYQEYDPDMQVMIMIAIGNDEYFQICEYTMEESTKWLEHIDCTEVHDRFS